MTIEDIDGIRPDMIDLSEGLISTFGQCEREELAEKLISFAQHRKNWDPFRRSELRAFLEYDIFLDDAESMDWLVNNDDGTYSFNGHFIRHAYDCHPAKT